MPMGLTIWFMYKYSLVTLCITCLFTGLGTVQSKQTLNQGLTGTVHLQQGNQMPMKGIAKRGKGKRLVCQLYVYPLLHLADVDHTGSVIHHLTEQPLTIAHTDSTGHFSISLPPGSYSVLIKWETVFYTDKINSADEINRVEISPDTWLSRDFTVRAGSTY